MAKSDWTGDPATLLRVTKGFDLSAVDPESTPGFAGGKSAAQRALEAGVLEFDTLQEKLFAASRSRAGTANIGTAGATEAPARSVLLILQAMDTAGKGGIVRHVVGSADPQGIRLHAFKAPTEEERQHDFLWRVRRQLPDPGYIGVFDRSHYEDVLIHRVRSLSTPEVIEARYTLINEFEADVAASGTSIVKVMLQISADEQKARLAERLERPDKHWKYNPGDVDERELWPAYQEAYQIALERTSTDQAPWFVVPANKKYYARIAVQKLLVDALRDIDPQWPAADFDVENEKARLAAS